MHLAAIAAVHGREGIRYARADNFFGDGLSLKTKLLRAESLKVASIEADQITLVSIKAKDLASNGLQSAEQVAIVLGEQGNVRAGEFNTDLLRGTTIGTGGKLIGADAVLEAEASELVEGGKETGDLLGSLLQVINRHN